MKKTVVWGHRGLPALHCENGLSGFCAAASCGASGVELDVQLTRDGRLAVIHDEELTRLTGRPGWVTQMTLEELRRSGEAAGKVPLQDFAPELADVYQALASTNLEINVELKTSRVAYEGIERAVLELSEQFGLLDRVIFSSFNHQSLLAVRRMSAAARLALLVSDVSLDLPAEARNLNAEALHIPCCQTKMAGLFEQYRKSGLLLRVWGADAAADWQRLHGAVDCLIVDDAPEALRVLSSPCK
ncbi:MULTISPECIES: glycerophosphodiester phosphodiesterase family protein [Jonquetella]|uniref:Glycerophosphoryl diester phosphodiesterase n=1 Tax=Jonquetella anthropi DSM 22815 TaxID=885272 RepID=H0ULQ5_9BACT|nr:MULTISPECIES: glycerophosphodiester phosphodiesterase family protein [Jonquetella]EEX48110.1 glycerophosphodiester phosphodiesterase family protein [Jonquetella anthropi E3_33 E1]EHM13546.1 glycerophosphoryl diester phosphodiesterase [Jonquetella anthropi DSM 22815]ERL24367.1 glycerophosphodiester phosphodiesterase family protein [Jonquetella sp. BV3C21]